MKNVPRYRFGEKIRKVRERRGITLREVAGRAHVSESLVSQIERNRVSPSVDTLIAVADALEIDLDYLFRDYKREKRLSLIRPDERAVQRRDGVTFERLSVIEDGDDAHGIEAVLLRIAPGAWKGDNEFGHQGKELGLILEGSGEMSYGNATYRLERGDCVSFSSDIPHILKNDAAFELQAVWIITPPRNVM